MLNLTTKAGQLKQQLWSPWVQHVRLGIERPKLVIVLHNPPVNLSPDDSEVFITKLRQHVLSGGDRSLEGISIMVDSTVIDAKVLSITSRGLTTTVAVGFQ